MGWEWGSEVVVSKLRAENGPLCVVSVRDAGAAEGGGPGAGLRLTQGVCCSG